jgi:hypothetical protein
MVRLVARPEMLLIGWGAGGLRFAFYGRMSTDDFQDLASSRQWQRTVRVAPSITMLSSAGPGVERSWLVTLRSARIAANDDASHPTGNEL